MVQTEYSKYFVSKWLANLFNTLEIKTNMFKSMNTGQNPPRL